ncbi:MAG: ABC transporter permease [Thermodesulfobacteriota bacterium]
MIWNAFLLALREIRRNVLRSFLTILGIVIGVAAVITLVTVGSGVTAKVAEDISKLGTNLLMVRPGQFRGPGGGASTAKAFTKYDLEALGREVTSVSAVAPSNHRTMTAIYGNTNWSTLVTGTDNGFFKVKDWTLEAGRVFTEGELRSGKAVCLIGATVRRRLFGKEDPIGQRIRMEKISFQVIGLLSSKGMTGMGTDQDDIVIVPLATLQRRIAGNQEIRMIQVSAKSEASTQKAQKDIERLLRERRRLAPGAPDDFTVMDMAEIAETMRTTTKMLTALLGAVAAVSLLVGGIGIMNIMLVSVTERTREIGTRMAIGALGRDVMIQFLVEAAVLSSLGGLVGLGLALAASYGLTRTLQVPFVFNPSINLVSFLFSAAVGVIFGFFPARRAAGLDPIEALRYE